MNSKIIIAIVAVVIVAVAGVALIMMNNNGDDVPSNGILYDGNGGKLSNGETTYKSDSTHVETCAFERDGYHWTVWNTKADGSGTDYSENSIAPAKTRLYAQWSDANIIFGDNDNTGYISIFVADSNGSNEVNIDDGYASISSDAIFIIKPQTGVTLKMHVDGKGIIAEKTDGKRYIQYSTGITGISFENGEIKDGAAVFKIKQTVSNQNVFLSCLSSSVTDVLDIGGTRDVPTDVMTFSLGVSKTGGIDINNTGSIQVGELAKIYVKAVKSGSTISYDGENTIKITVSEKEYDITISFKNGGELTGVTIDGDTAIISFTYDSDKDPSFIRIISNN